MEAGKQTDILILDFLKAFDKVNHSLLIHNLSYYEIRGKVNAWIGDFLKDRNQAINVSQRDLVAADFTLAALTMPFSKNNKKGAGQRDESPDRPRRTVRRTLRFEEVSEPQDAPANSRKAINARYRSKILSDPARAAAFKAEEAQRMRQYRASLTAEKKDQQNQKRRERYRNQRDAGLIKKPSKPLKPQTRSSQQAQDELRERNRLSQQKRRANMSAQKKPRERERSLAYYHAQKAPSKSKDASVGTDPISAPKSTTTRSSAVYRLRQKLGAGKKLLLNIKHLVRAHQKKHGEHLEALGVTYSSPTKRPPAQRSSTDLDRVIKTLKPLRSLTSLKAKSMISHAAQSVMDKYSVQRYGILKKRKDQDQPYRRKEKASDALIKTFYEDNSVFLPAKASVDRNLNSKKILDKSIVTLFHKFVQDHGSLVARATFFRKKPRHVLSFFKTPFRQCMCDICLNPIIKMSVVNKLCGCKIDSVRELVRMTVCENLKRVCLMRKCVDYGLDGMNELLNVARLRCGDEVEWKRWEKVEKKGMSRLELVSKRADFETFVGELKSESEKLALHDFVHRWQTGQYQKLCKSVPQGWAVLTLDFAENYLCRQQDQPQSAYYGYSQVTVHPCVLYFNCGCDDRVTSNIVYLSDVLIHSANMVFAILQDLFLHHIPPDVHHVVIFSDGCSSQYKSKLPFFFLMNLSSFSKLSVERCYFGARHGKNPCDALGGVVKQAASRAVRSRQTVIQNTADLLAFCNDSLRLEGNPTSGCTHNHVMRSFSVIKEEDLPHMTSSSLKTLPGTRSIHSARPDSAGLLVRNLSCFCSACLSGQFEDCPNSEFVGNWKRMKNTESWASSVSNTTSAGAASEDSEDQPPAIVEHVFRTSTPVLSSPCDTLDNAFIEPASLVHSPDNSGHHVDSDCNIVPTTLPFSLTHDSREAFFAYLSNLMSNCSTYSHLTDCVNAHSPFLSRFPLPDTLYYPSIFDCRGTVDLMALKLIPKGLESLYPLVIEADGNCVPRSLSVYLFGSQDYHLEIRCRIVIELIKNSSVYLSLPPVELQTISVLSDFHGDDVSQTYQLEVLDVSRPSSYMGMWQLMAASNVFGAPIVSVYPTLGPATISSFFNRTLQPIHPRDQNCIVLLWSSCREDMDKEYWVANHVVPLLHLTTPCAVEVD